MYMMQYPPLLHVQIKVKNEQLDIYLCVNVCVNDKPYLHMKYQNCCHVFHHFTDAMEELKKILKIFSRIVLRNNIKNYLIYPHINWDLGFYDL